MSRFLDFIGKVIVYFVLLGLLGRFAVDVFVGLLEGIGIELPDLFSRSTFVGYVMLLLLIVSGVLAKITSSGVSVWFISKQRQLKREQELHKETERRLPAQLEQERHQREEIERQLKQEIAPAESHWSSEESFNGDIQTGINDLDNSPIQNEVITSTPQRTPKFISKLRDLLASKNWDKADKETLKIMLQVTGREKEGWLDVASIQNFPCEELRAIDQLWLQFSNGRFGFSVQKRMWKSVGGNLKADDKIYQAFGDRVGWRVNGNWIQIPEISFKSSATVGHLPATAVRLGGLSWGVDGFWWEKREAYVFLLSKKNW